MGLKIRLYPVEESDIQVYHREGHEIREYDGESSIAHIHTGNIKLSRLKSNKSYKVNKYEGAERT